jgi:hypothetical protein
MRLSDGLNSEVSGTVSCHVPRRFSWDIVRLCATVLILTTADLNVLTLVTQWTWSVKAKKEKKKSS